jgi:hypothetical protein
MIIADESKKIDVCIFDRLGFEEVVGLKFDLFFFLVFSRRVFAACTTSSRSCTVKLKSGAVAAMA